MKLEKEEILNESLRQYIKREVSQDDLKVKEETRHHFMQLFQNVAAAIYACDATGRITMFNESAADLWGRRPEIGKDLWCGSWKVFYPDGRPMALSECPMAITLKNGRVTGSQEIVVERPDGVRRHVLPKPRPLYDSSGRLSGAVNLLIDITELREAYAMITESEQRFRTLAENTPVTVWTMDEKGICNYLNPEWMRLSGSSCSGLGTEWLGYIDPDDRTMVSSKLEEAIAKNEKLNLKFRLINGSGESITVHAIGNPQFRSDGKLAGYIGTFQDVTSQEMTKAALEEQVAVRTMKSQQQSEQLRVSEERYHRMIDEVEDYAIILLDQDGVIENWNKGAEKIKGYTSAEIIGRNFRIFYSKEDQEMNLPGQLLNKARLEGRATHEGWRCRKNGSTFWGSIVITALHDTSGNVTGFSKVTRDLTDKKIAEEELKNKAIQILEKNKDLEIMNQELASFAYVSSHDLQEPLRKIQTFASRIVETEHESLSPKGKDYFIRMQNAALRMQTLIEDLLTYSRTNTTVRQFDAVDLNKLVTEIKTELRESIDEKNAVIECEPLPTLEVIVFQFRQLLINLLNNALKFSKTGEPPHIQITSDVVKGTEINNKYAIPRKTYHHIAVKDNGIGFEPEHKQRIFDVFHRLHGRSEYTGTGIGLAICKKVVENHGGFITADSEPGVGATFNVYIPQH